MARTYAFACCEVEGGGGGDLSSFRKSLFFHVHPLTAEIAARYACQPETFGFSIRPCIFIMASLCLKTSCTHKQTDRQTLFAGEVNFFSLHDGRRTHYDLALVFPSKNISNEC